MDPAEITFKVRRAVAVIRANWYPRIQPALSERQALSGKDFPFKGPLHICKTEFPIANDDELQWTFLEAIAEEGKCGTAGFHSSGGESVKVEWNGYRRESKSGGPSRKEVVEREKYRDLIEDTTSDVTVLYVHGGGYMSVDLFSTFSSAFLLLKSKYLPLRTLLKLIYTVLVARLAAESSLAPLQKRQEAKFALSTIDSLLNILFQQRCTTFSWLIFVFSVRQLVRFTLLFLRLR